LCVDDNEAVAEALRVKFERHGEFDWVGRLASADDLVSAAQELHPDFIVLDVDMPGKNPFEAMQECSESCPETRTVLFTGYVRRELIERALDCGAWGYVSKNDGEDELILALRSVLDGQLGLSSEASQLYQG
jgi:DNA-binding NarL/FixJ family response regulator